MRTMFEVIPAEDERCDPGCSATIGIFLPTLNGHERDETYYPDIELLFFETGSETPVARLMFLSVYMPGIVEVNGEAKRILSDYSHLFAEPATLATVVDRFKEDYEERRDNSDGNSTA